MNPLFQLPPYSLTFQHKEASLLKELNILTVHHIEHSHEYHNLVNHLKLPQPPYSTLNEIPRLPINLFKKYDLKSIPNEDVYKTLLSSGTTAAQKSRIYLDRKTSQLQTQALATILTDFLGQHRLPILIVDQENVFSDPKQFSARGAALLGMLNFGRDPFYLLDQNSEIRRKELDAWVNKYTGTPILIFGLTFMVWNHFLNGLQLGALNLPNALLFHTGGWKKLESLAISNEDFKHKANIAFGIQKCHNFYGFVEQVGSIFVECEQSVFHSSNFSEVIIRDPNDNWRPAEQGKEGIVQTLSILPWSYPGHSLLTEDIGIWTGLDNCPCGRKGKTFKIKGRIPRAEPRGCSDVGS